jgi:hypothetical protein
VFLDLQKPLTSDFYTLYRPYLDRIDLRDLTWILMFLEITNLIFLTSDFYVFFIDFGRFLTPLFGPPQSKWSQFSNIAKREPLSPILTSEMGPEITFLDLSDPSQTGLYSNSWPYFWLVPLCQIGVSQKHQNDPKWTLQDLQKHRYFDIFCMFRIGVWASSPDWPNLVPIGFKDLQNPILTPFRTVVLGHFVHTILDSHGPCKVIYSA